MLSIVAAFFNLIRYKNLLILCLAQLLLKFFLIESLVKDKALAIENFSLLVLSTIFIAAAGNIINDVFDIKTDRINKPNKQFIGKSVTVKTAKKLYLFLTICGILLGCVLSFFIDKPLFSLLFIGIALLLYLYAFKVKKVPLIGNLLVSGLTAFSILIIALFEVSRLDNNASNHLSSLAFSIIIIYTCFAFFLNLLREIVKDIQDVNGDYNTGIRSIPILIGRERTSKCLAILNLIGVATLVFLCYNYLYAFKFIVLYVAFFIVLPMIYFSYIAWDAEIEKTYGKMSSLLKLIMVWGILSLIPLYFFSLKNL